MMKVSGWHLLLTASLLLSMSTGVAAHASGSETSGSEDAKGEEEKVTLSQANEEMQALLVTEVVTGDHSATEQYIFAQRELTQCHLNSNSTNPITKPECKAAFGAAVKVVNNDLKDNIKNIHLLVGTWMGFDVKKIEKKLDWLVQNNIRPRQRKKLRGVLKEIEDAATSLKQTSQATVSCEIGGLEADQFTKKDFDDIREEFEGMINIAHILNSDDTYMKNFTWDDEATETETQVRDLEHSHGRQLRRRIRLTGRGTNGCRCCNKNKIKDNTARKRRRLPGGSFKSAKGHAKGHPDPRFEKVESKWSKDSKSNEKPMLDMWEGNLCTEGFTLKHANRAFATLVTNKIGSQEDNEDFSVSCCFT